MKYKYHSRFIAIVVMVSLLLTCMIMPTTAITSNESLNSADNPMTGNELLTDGEFLLSDEKMILHSNDPMIPGFRQWYILQHWSELHESVQPKPFVTVISYTVPISGTY